MINIKYRVEKKYLVSDGDLLKIKQRLAAIMSTDEHQSGQCYEIRSVYFDNICDSCFHESESGVDMRKKFRIRCYNGSDEVIKLEIKEKQMGFNRKISCPISREEYELLLAGGELPFGDRVALNQLLLNMQIGEMKAKTLVRYERTAFVHPSGNVRITFDRNISACSEFADFFSECVSDCVPVLEKGMHVLEVKYDEFLPDIISKQLEIGNLRQTTFSKYYLGRLAINGEMFQM